MSVHAQTVDLENDLVAHYLFNGSIEDESGLGRESNLIEGGGYSPDRFGNKSQALLLNKSERSAFEIDVRDMDMNGSNDFSISLWWLLLDNEENQTAAYHNLVQINTAWENVNYSSGGSWDMFRFRGYFHYHDNYTHRISAGQSGNGPVNVPRDFEIWQNYIYVYKNHQFYFYHNGELTAKIETRYNHDNDTAARVLRFGGHQPTAHIGGGEIYFMIDDIRIYKSAINVEEISSLYNSEKVPVLTKPIKVELTGGGAVEILDNFIKPKEFPEEEYLIVNMPLDGVHSDKAAKGVQFKHYGLHEFTEDRFGTASGAWSLNGNSGLHSGEIKDGFNLGDRSISFWLKRKFHS